MKKNKIHYILVLFLVFGSCREYVEVEPVGNSRELIYDTDYRRLANNYTTFEYGWSYPLVSCDDTYFNIGVQNAVSDIIGRIYTWPDFFFEEGLQDADWSNCYLAIYNSNVITDGVMDSKGGTETEKKETMAMAKVHRAFAYLSLVNCYAPHYSVTSLTKKAVPLLLTSDLFTPLNRATVGEVYTQIVKDLTEALPYLPELPEFNVLPSQVSAYALLARTYLFMAAYDKALTNAQKALELQSTLIDFNAYASDPYSYPVLEENPEVILNKKATYAYYGAPLSDGLLALVVENDLRKDVYLTSGDNYITSNNFGFGDMDDFTFGLNFYSYTNGVNIGPSVPEMLLIKAECQARLNDGDGAIATINSLRAKRFDSTSDYEVVLGIGESALDYVLRERRIELMGRGFRWFDMKRFNLEIVREITVERVLGDKTYTLEPNSEGYVYPIFQDYITLNPELGE